MASIQPRCGSLVTGAAFCPDCQHQDGHSIPSPPSPRAAGTRTLLLGTLGWPAASPLMESGSSPTLCLRGGWAMCPGRVQPGYSSWEEGAPAPAQNCSPPPPTPQHLISVCHIRPCNNCVDSHCKYSSCYIFISSGACAIELEDRVVVTGGDYPPIATVQVYTLSGPQEQLPSLQTGRHNHACAQYLDSQDRVVSIRTEL